MFEMSTGDQLNPVEHMSVQSLPLLVYLQLVELEHSTDDIARQLMKAMKN